MKLQLKEMTSAKNSLTNRMNQCSGHTECPSMRCVRMRKTFCRRKLPTANECFKLARAGRPSQKLALPAESYGTLSQQQAEGIVKAAARRLKDKTLAAQAEMAGLNNDASEQISDEPMNVEKVGVAREVLRSNSSAQQLGTTGMQVDQLRTVREVTTTTRESGRVGSCVEGESLIQRGVHRCRHGGRWFCC